MTKVLLIDDGNPVTAALVKRAADIEILEPEKSDDYAIIGTRDPDEAQMEVAYRLAWAITTLGRKFVRTGAAYGIDQRAMEGSRPDRLKVYLPWGSYNRDLVPAGCSVVVYTPSIHAAWADSVARFHPNPRALSRGAFALHARNFGIVSDPPVKAVIAFPGPSGSGGTGQGMRIARDLGIPVIQHNKGSITDAPRLIGKILQDLGFASKDLAPTYRPSETGLF